MAVVVSRFEDAPNKGIVLSVQLGWLPSCVTRCTPTIVHSLVGGYNCLIEPPWATVGMLSGAMVGPDTSAGFDVHGGDLDLKLVGYPLGYSQPSG